MMNNHNTFYSNGAWKHNEGDFQTYYNSKQPHIVDLVIPQHLMDGKLSANVFYTSDSTWYNDSTKTYQTDDLTYDGLIAYNTNQSSGYMPIVVKQNNFQQDQVGSVMVDKVDNKYRINDLRDLVVASNNPI